MMTGLIQQIHYSNFLIVEEGLGLLVRSTKPPLGRGSIL